MSDFLEVHTTQQEKDAGFDIADYLLRYQGQDKGTNPRVLRDTHIINDESKIGTVKHTSLPLSITKKYPNVQTLVEKLDCQYLGNAQITIEEEKTKDDSILLKAQAIKLIENVRSAKLPEDPFDISPGIQIFDANKFVKAQQHILEQVSPDKPVFKAAYDRLHDFYEKLA